VYCIASNKMTTRSGAIYNQAHSSQIIQTPTQTLLNATNTLKLEYEVNIDFDEASKAWRANKRRVGESWVYVKPKAKRSSSRGKR